MLKKVVECVCGKRTDDYYEIKTNTGIVYKCVPCYESGFNRDHREEYGSAYQNTDLSSKIKKRF